MSNPIKKVLIANRGEIAVRIIRCLRDLNLQSVAIYSEADSESTHRKLADEAFPLQGRSSADTYLNIPKIIEAAKKSGADAIHPGYGFLSERSDFAKAIEEAGLVFVGPSADAMEVMGNKISAKDLMKEHDVPTVPGSDGQLRSVAELEKLVDRIGFPLILKAAAGGGGRGMRIVQEKAELKSAFESCQREAISYFGDDAVFAERYISNPRHIEIQVLCDGKNGVHLFERDCSIQRRHQKLIEEAPSQYLNDEQRQELGRIALKAALAVGYSGAGTVEFICESPDKAYFMEMNTRIQVEHPVTEVITGVDLIEQQLLVAQGRPLELKQEDISIRGWSFEARINAEAPERDFAPTPGYIEKLTLPQGPGVRVDTHVYEGYTVPSEYDSMIAKLIVSGRTREQALHRLRRALGELEIQGVQTTAIFHRALIEHPNFIDANFTTGFLNEHGAGLIKHLHASSSDPFAHAASLIVQQAESQVERANPHDSRQGWQNKSLAESQQQH